MQKFNAFHTCLFFLLSPIFCSAQLVHFNYEITAMSDQRHKVAVYMYSKASTALEIGAINLSFALDPTCASVSEFQSMFKDSWTEYLERDQEVKVVPTSYEGQVYEQRWQYGNADPGLPSTAPVTLPARQEERMTVLEMVVEGACSNQLYMEHLGQNSLNQIADPAMDLIDYIITHPRRTSSMEFLAFEGYALDQRRTQLIWETKNETDSDFFEIQKSADPAFNQFDVLGKVEGAGTTAYDLYYQYIDETEMEAVNYYRLRHVTFDGSETHSDIVAIRFDKEETPSFAFDVQIYPNPTQDKAEVSIKGENGHQIQLTLSDMTGRILLTKEVTLGRNGENQLRVDLLDQAEGVYVLDVRNLQVADDSQALRIIKR